MSAVKFELSPLIQMRFCVRKGAELFDTRVGITYWDKLASVPKLFWTSENWKVFICAGASHAATWENTLGLRRIRDSAPNPDLLKPIAQRCGIVPGAAKLSPKGIRS